MKLPNVPSSRIDTSGATDKVRRPLFGPSVADRDWFGSSHDLAEGLTVLEEFDTIPSELLDLNL